MEDIRGIVCSPPRKAANYYEGSEMLLCLRIMDEEKAAEEASRAEGAVRSE